jgi:hypothetical protein
MMKFYCYSVLLLLWLLLLIVVTYRYVVITTEANRESSRQISRLCGDALYSRLPFDSEPLGVGCTLALM